MSNSSNDSEKDSVNESVSESSEDPPADQITAYKGKFSAERLMMMLDKERLEALEEEFDEHPDGIELHNFIWLMKSAIVVEPEEQTDFILGLYYLFQDIDINGDEHMEWSEFTQYIIDAVMSVQGREKTDDKDVHPSEIMEMALTYKSRRYHLSKVVDRNFHEAFMRHVAYHPVLDLVSVIEMGSDSVKFFDTASEIKMVLTPKYKGSGFVLSMAYSHKERLMVLVCSDKRFYLFEKDGSSFKPKGSFQTNGVSLIIWYFEIHDVWVSACEDNNLRTWDMKANEEGFVFKGHEETILDAVEIRNPKSLVTAAMDGNIIIWDVNECRVLATLAGKHPRGVRTIDYCAEYGGNIVSVGYERDIHMWSPDATLTKCYAGKLEGHNCPVVTCKFFKARPTCISADEKANVRVWDIRYKSCLQIIPHDRGNVEVSRLVTLNRHEKFIVAGRRLVWYDLLKDSINKGYKDVHPVYVDFNTYFFQIFVMTKCDLRIYDCMTGRLLKIFTEIQDLRTESELSAMIMDFRNRVFFVGDNSGAIRAYNCANGVFIKKISVDAKEKVFGFGFREEDEEGEEEMEGLNSEISAFLYCNDEKMLIVSSWDSTIAVYDLKDVEEVELLRLMKGGHQGSDITCIAYSPFLSMIASGSSNGTVAVWDFELGKLQGASFGHKREITSLAFLDPYPILITFSIDNMICLWHLKTFGNKTRLKCLMRLKNFSWSGSSDTLSPITVSLSLLTATSPIQKLPRKRYKKQKKANPRSQESTLNFFKTHEGQQNSDSDSESSYEWVEDPLPYTFPHPTDSQVRERLYLYIGDTCGYLKIWNFDNIFNKHRIFPSCRREKDKISYNPYRKDLKNAESDIRYWRKEADTEELPPVQSVESEILIKEWKGHEDQITCIRPVHDPKALLSCSSDRFVKVWSREGELWGKINVALPEIPKKWFFPYDWESKKRKDVSKIKEVLELIEDKIEINSKDLEAPPKVESKKKKGQEIELKIETENRREVLSTRKQKLVMNKYDFEDYDEKDEEDREKEVDNFKKNFESVADLQKQLDDMDEMRNAGYDQNRFDLTKKYSKSRAGFTEIRRVESLKVSQNKLPKIGSVRNKSGAEEGILDRTRGMNQSFCAKPKPEARRPIIGRENNGVLNTFNIQAGGKKFRIKKKEDFDTRFKSGESIRVMNRAISSHTILQGSTMEPYTEDLRTLKRKNDLIKELVNRKLDKGSEKVGSRKKL